VTFAAGPIEPGVGDRITAQAMAALNKERFAELVAEGRKLDQAAGVGAGAEDRLAGFGSHRSTKLSGHRISCCCEAAETWFEAAGSRHRSELEQWHAPH